MSVNYFISGDILVERILKAIPEHPEILTLDSPFGLYKIPNLKMDDLELTLGTASAALGIARKRWLESKS